jgi:hypothetical protein
MVAEIPNPECLSVPAEWKDAFRAARRTIDDAWGPARSRLHILETPATIELHGVGFYDRYDGKQTWWAANNREIHPVTHLEVGVKYVPELIGFSGSISISPNAPHDRLTAGRMILNLPIKGKGKGFRTSIPASQIPWGVYYVHAVSKSGYIAKKFSVER